MTFSPESTSFARLLAVDPSLTCSGWALFDVTSGALISFGVLRTLPPAQPLAERLQHLQFKVVNLFRELGLNGDNHLLICEGPTTMRDPKAAIKVERVRGIFEAVARSRHVAVPGRLNPRTVQRELLGMKGKQLPRALVKGQAVRVVISLHGESLRTAGIEPSERGLRRHQDVVDAILIGTVGLERVRSASRAGVGVEELLSL